MAFMQQEELKWKEESSVERAGTKEDSVKITNNAVTCEKLLYSHTIREPLENHDGQLCKYFFHKTQASHSTE